MVVDSGLEKILNQLDTAGFLENTVVILTADHGDQLASHGGLFNKDTLMVEEVMKVPLVIRWPERVKAGEKDYVPVANMDLVETVLELGGAEGLLATDGVSVLGEKRREHLMCETYGLYRECFAGNSISISRIAEIWMSCTTSKRIPSRWRTGLKMRDIARFSVK